MLLFQNSAALVSTIVINRRGGVQFVLYVRVKQAEESSIVSS